jgi:SecD/SecF fusion protein
MVSSPRLWYVWGSHILTGQQNRLALAGILLLAILAGFMSWPGTHVSPVTHRKVYSQEDPNLLHIRTYYGLDIRGGVRVTLRPKIEEYQKTHPRDTWSTDKLDTVKQVLEKRVNFQGVSEPLIYTKPENNQIIVELPGLKDDKEALARLQSTASLQFYLLNQLGKKDSPGIWSISRDKDGNEVLVNTNTRLPITPEELDAQVFDQPPIASGEDMIGESCKADLNPQSGAYIDFEFDPTKPGASKFEETTRAYPDHYLAIFLDKKLLTAPTINGPISGKGIIEGNFTLEQARDLANQLKAGALPVPLEVQETRKLEATLGREAVAATTLAGGVGLLLVLIFMIAYYRLPGVLASVALILYSLFSFALLKWIPVTLTLPGIAGFILSIGMAVDANILIFERLKEELRAGKTLRAGIDAGFKRAFTAILDSNVCTLITCGFLYWLGTGPIRGFALTLALGVVVSMFTAITVTRTFLFALVGFNWAQNQGAYGLSFQFTPAMHVMKRKLLWLGISGAIIIPGLIFWALGGVKQSIDFKGGTELQIPYASRHSAEEIERQLVAMNPRYKDSRVVLAGGTGTQTNAAIITLPQLTDEERQQAIEKLTDGGKELAPGMTMQSVGYSKVSGAISDQLRNQAILAIFFASATIVLYLALRFAIGGFKEGLKYGSCAVIALLHDVLVLWGAFAILGYFLNWQIDSLFVTAMLTVVGFSVHDTIIVFDRIRENLQHRQRGENFSDLSDRSIDQTIARSINTSFTVVLTLLALFLFGGSVVHQFAGALLIGIISGTYSSIFNASVLLVIWKEKDSGLALAGVGSAVGPRSGLAARGGETRPGDRPLVTPKPNANAYSAPRTPEKAPEDEAADDVAYAPEDGKSRPATTRRQTQRRQRRM